MNRLKGAPPAMLDVRRNKFDLMRLLAAVAVLYTHAWALAIGNLDAEPIRLLLGKTPGDIGVDLFFVTSGFLVTASFMNKPHLGRFLWARFVRIYPALVVAVALTVLLGLALTNLPADQYLGDWHTRHYLFSNMTLLGGERHGLPGVFADAPFGTVSGNLGYANGSLWTLPYEVRLYLGLALLGLVGLSVFRNRLESTMRVAVTLLALAGAIGVAFISFGYDIKHSTDAAVRFMSLFFAGGAFYLWRDRIRLSWLVFFISIALFGGLLWLDQRIAHSAYALALPYWVLCVAYLPIAGRAAVALPADYSYGLYIYHWPIMQTLVQGVEGVNWPTVFVVGLFLSFIMAYTSWHLVEKRALQLKKLAWGKPAEAKRRL